MNSQMCVSEPAAQRNATDTFAVGDGAGLFGAGNIGAGTGLNSVLFSQYVID